MNKVYTPKQRELMRLWQKNKLKRINLLEGSVRSGKTWISLVLWAFWVATMPKDKNYLMVAKTLTSLRRNCLDLLQDLVGAKYFTYSLSKKEGCLFGRKIYLEGVNDARAESKIRGMTLIGAYCDELTLFTEDFFAMLLSRLSEKGAKIIATTNPDSPNHWLMTRYINRIAEDDLDMYVEKFLIDDNTFLDKEYVDNLKKEYTGVFYDRYILGMWKRAEGIIYADFADNPSGYIINDIDKDKIAFASIGVDFGGNMSAHAFILNGFTRNFKEVVTLDEFYLKKKISPFELEQNFIEFVRRNQAKYRIYEAYCDSAETTLIEGLKIAVSKNGVPIDVLNAKKGDINNRIRFYQNIMSHNRYKVLSHCKSVIKALEDAVWDEKSLKDKRLDDGTMNVDSLDALEYSTEVYMKDIVDIGVIKCKNT